MIPLSIPNLAGNELAYVSRAIEDGWVSTAGPFVEEFEDKLAAYVGVKQACSCQNGTSAIHLALRVGGVEPEELVLVPALTFIAAVNPVTYVGAKPIFMDCDDSLCMDPKKVEAYCRTACDFDGEVLIDKQSGRRVKALVVVHVFGNLADMDAFLRLAETYKLLLIEDATEALGSYYRSGPLKGKFAGTMGDFGCYSFNGNKIITTGGGGMLVAREPDNLKRAKHLATQAKSDLLYFEHDEIGYNYRMTNLQAAMGLAQLELLEGFIETKKENWQRYYEALHDVKGYKILPFRNDIRPNYWFYSLLCEGTPYDRDSLIRHLQACKIQSRPIWSLIPEQKPYREAQTYPLEKAAYYWKHIVNLPCSSQLTAEECRYVIEAVLN